MLWVPVYQGDNMALLQLGASLAVLDNLELLPEKNQVTRGVWIAQSG